MEAQVLAFDDLGEGPAVVFVHGHPFDRSMWQLQRQPLVDAGFRFIAPDLRGYGETPPEGSKVTMAELADDIVGLLDRLAIEQAAVIGLSMGGLVAMELAIRTDRLWALALVATTAEPVAGAERERRLRLAEAAERDGMEPLVEVMREDLLGPDCRSAVVDAVEAMMRANNPHGAAAALRGRAERPDYRPGLRALALPTLICAGTADRFSTKDVTGDLIACLPGASTLILPGVGHMPNLEAPDEFNTALVRFLKTALGAE